MKRVVLGVIMFVVFGLNAFAQNPTYFVSGDYATPGTWNPTGSNGQMTATGFGSTFQIATTALATGTKYFRFYSAAAATGSVYGPTSASSTILTNTIQTSQTGNATFAYALNITSTSDNIIFNGGPGAPGTAKFIAFDLASAPATITAVSQLPVSGAVNSGQFVTITATLSGTGLSTGQGVYLRSSTDNFVTSTVNTMTGSGTTYSFTMPAATASTSVKYYVFTSGNGMTITGADADLCTINANTNSGANYSYTVGPAINSFTYISAQTGLWSAASTWVGGVVPPTSATTNVQIVSGHNVTQNNTVTLNGSVQVDGTLTISNNFQVNTFTGAGTINGTTNSTITIGLNDVSGTFSGVISNTANALTLIKNGAGTFTLNGTNNSYSGTTTINKGTLAYYSIQNVSGGNSSLGAPATIANGTINFTGTGTLQFLGASNSTSNRVINFTNPGVGTIDASGTSGAVLTLTSAITSNAGGLNATLTGTGIGIESGGIATTSASQIKKTGTGTWTLSGAAGGGINQAPSITGGGTLIQAITTSLGGTANSGAMALTGIYQYTGTAAFNMNTASPAYAITLGGNSIINESGTGLLTTPGIALGANTLILTGSTNGTAAGIISGTGSLTKNGNNTWTLSNTNSYTGTTTITTGTLVFGITNALPTSSPGNVVMNGGTLSNNGFSGATMGKLTVQDNSTIALSNTVNNLKFAASNTVTPSWLAGKVLTIKGWVGTPGVSGTKGQIFVGSSGGLTASELAQIQFDGYALGAVIQLASGEIVPTGWAITDFYVNINATTATNPFVMNGSNGDAHTTTLFSGASTITTSTNFSLTDIEIYTSRSSTQSICTSTLYYSVNPIGTTPSAFTAISLTNFGSGSYGATTGGSGTVIQRLGYSSPSIDLLCGLATGSYTLSMYVTFTGNSSSSSCPSTANTLTANNGGSYYTLNFINNNTTYNTPIISALPTGTVCAGTNITYTAGTGSNYSWTIPGIATSDYTLVSGGTSGSNTTVIKWLTSGTKNVGVTYSVSSCSYLPTPASVTSTIDLPTISGTATICSSGTTTLTGSGTAFSTNPWTYTAGTGTASLGTNSGTSMIVTGATAGNVSVTYKDNNGCTSAGYNVAITAFPSTSVAGVNQNICTSSANTTILAANNPTNGMGTWSVVSGPNTSSSQFGNAGVYNTVFTPTVVTGVNSYVLQWSISNSPCTVPSTSTVTVVFSTPGTWIGGTDNNWNTAANWSCATVPTSTTDVVIPSGTTFSPVISAAPNAAANTLTINTGATLTISGSQTISISSGGSITNNGTFITGAGTVVLLATSTSTSTISGSTPITFNNLTIYGNTNLSSASTINGTLLFNAISPGNAFAKITGTSPSYACTSLLEYNTGITQARGAEWTTAISGAGYPGSVQVTGGTFINGNNGGNNNIALCKDLTIDIGSALYMDYGSTGSSTLTVGGNALINGSLSLGYASGGDIYMDGNLTVGASAIINYNTASHSYLNSGGGGRALNFIGSGTQTITYTSGGTLYIPIININQNTAGGKLQLATATNIIMPDYQSTLNVLKLEQGDLDLNGQTLTINGSPNAAGYYIGILASGATRTITGKAGSVLAITAASFWPGVSSVSVNTASGGSLVTDLNVAVTTNVGFAPTASTTVNGILQLNQLGVSTSSNGFITDRNNYLFATTGTNVSGHCIFGSQSTLINNDGGNFSRNIEWDATGIGTIGVTPGYPNNVTIMGGTIYNIGDATTTSGIADRAMNGTLTIQSGSSVQLGTMDNGSHHLYVGGDVNISGTLQLATGTTSTSQTAGDIYVGSNWTRNTGGVFDYNATNPRAVTFNNATSGTIVAPTSTGETFAYAYLSKTSTAAKITLADSVTITQQLGLNEGTMDLSNSNLTIVSGRYNTANIGTTTTPANVILPYSGTGRFVIQRFFPARRAWRLITAPVKASAMPPTINEAWQEGVINTSNTISGIKNPSPGFGTLITGPFTGTGGAPFGFDPGTQPNASIYYMNSSGTSWLVPFTTTGTKVTDYPGYLVFVRGNRNYIIGTQYTPADTAILNPKGQINVGDTTITASGAGFKVIGNPYASGFNFITATTSGLFGGAHPVIYEWDAGLTGVKEVGAFVTLAWNGTKYTCVPKPVNPMDSTSLRIESGEAFMVKFASAGSVTIHESDKTTMNALVFRPAGVNEEVSLRANLYAYNADGSISLNDGVLNLFDPSYNNAVDISDAPKLGNVAENLMLKRNGYSLSVESRVPLTVTDTIFYNLTQLATIKYRLQLIGTNLDTKGLLAFIEDTLLHTKTMIDLNSINNIDFSIPDAATASKSANRFRIVFKHADAAPVPVPVTFKSIEALQQGNTAIVNVKWEVTNELNIREYEIEKSVNGKDFFVIGISKAAGSNLSGQSYYWQDLNGSTESNFYRIKSIDANGVVQYSNVVKVNIGILISGISIYPNPVLGGNVNVHLSNLPIGQYGLRVFNSGGQLMSAVEEVDYVGGSQAKTIIINNYMAGGLYNLEITNPDKSKSITTFTTRRQ